MVTQDAKNAKTLTRQKKGKIRAQSQFFRSARYGLTLQEHRIIYYSILRGQQDHKPFEPVTLAVKDFMELCELKGGSSYSTLRNVCKKLVGRTVEFIHHDSEGAHWTAAPWLSDITYHTKAGSVTITPNKALRKLFEGKPYTETEFYYLVKFTSQYAERLYEILKSFDFKDLIDFDIDDLRGRLSIPPKQYPNFNMLRTRILTPAIQDINEFTDLTVSLHEKRGARNKVVSVFFTVEKKSVLPLYDRINAGEFTPPLSPEEQDAVLREFLDGNEPAQLSIDGLVTPT